MARKLNTDMAKQERAASANSRDTNTQREKRREKGRWYLKNYDAMKAVASMKNPWADNNHCNNDELYNCHLPDHPCMLIVPGIVGNRDSEERDCGKARLFWGTSLWRGADSFVRILVLLCSLGRFANTPSPKSWPILVSSRSSDEEDLADMYAIVVSEAQLSRTINRISCTCEPKEAQRKGYPQRRRRACRPTLVVFMSCHGARLGSTDAILFTQAIFAIFPSS